MTDEFPVIDETIPNPAGVDAAGVVGDSFPVQSPPPDQDRTEEGSFLLDAQPKPQQSEEAPEVREQVPPESAARRLSREDRQAYERIIRRFQVCGRCGYFLADCRLALGEGTLQQIILGAQSNWITIEGTEALRPLLVRAFGIRLDQGFDYYDGLCPECRRRFTFSTEDEGRIRLKIRI